MAYNRAREENSCNWRHNCDINENINLTRLIMFLQDVLPKNVDKNIQSPEYESVMQSFLWIQQLNVRNVSWIGQ